MGKQAKAAKAAENKAGKEAKAAKKTQKAADTEAAKERLTQMEADESFVQEQEQEARIWRLSDMKMSEDDKRNQSLTDKDDAGSRKKNNAEVSSTVEKTLV